MKILPLRTLPPDKRIERRHAPPEGTGRFGYRDYRPCLRWEFGFTCAFCLLHERDLADLGAEGLGLTWIEHFALASSDPQKVNDYRNCFYACRYCNGNRSRAPLVDESGRRLINPGHEVWAERFSCSEDDRLLPDPADPDAVYTAEAYDLNDSRKVTRRRLRRERLTELLEILNEGPLRVQRFVALAERLDSPEQSGMLLEEAELLLKSIRGAATEILRYAAVPKDADDSCLCDRTDRRTLPDWLASQTFDVPNSPK
jgi:hypothetical protein